MNRIAIAVGLLVIWTALAVAAGWSWRADRAEATSSKRDTADATAVTAAVQDARATEHTQAGRLADIGAKHEEDRRDAESVPAAVVAELQSGDLQLRKHWAACETSRLSDASAAAREFDALAELRRKDQGDLVRVGHDANDLARGLQAVITTDRTEN